VEVAPNPSVSSAVLTGQTALTSAGADLPYYFRSVAQVGLQVATALAHAHQRGIIHRDVKPSNLLLDLSGVTWVTDFGLAKSDDDGLTSPGDVVGTLRYVAPERFSGRCDARADVYSLGLTLYEMLVLRPAFDSADRLRLVEMVRDQEPVAPRRIDRRIPRDLETIVLKAIDRDESRRYQTAEALADDLRRFLADEPISARRALFRERLLRWVRHNRAVAAALAAVFVMLLAGLAGVLYSNVKISGARDDAVKAAAAAEASEKRQAALRSSAEVRLYAARMALAQHAWGDSEVGRAAQLVDLCRPAPGERDLRGWEWYYLDRLCRSEKLNLKGHDGPVFAVAYSPDGKVLASAGGGNFYFQTSGGVQPGQVIVRDAADGRVLSRLEGFGHLVTCLAFDREGQFLAAGSHDGKVRVWRVAGAEKVAEWDAGAGGVSSIGFAADGKTLLVGAGNARQSGNTDRSVRLFDWPSGKERKCVVEKWKAPLTGATLAPDGRSVVYAAERWVRCVTAEGKPVWQQQRAAPVLCHCYSRDGRLVAMGAEDGRVVICDATDGRIVHNLGQHLGAVRCVAFSADGKLLASAGNTPEVRLWDVGGGEQVRTIRGPTAIIESVAFSPDGKRLATGDHQGLVKVYDATADQRGLLLDHGPVGYAGRSTLVLAQGKVRVALMNAHRADHLDLTSGDVGRRPLPQMVPDCPAAFSHDGRLLAFPPDGERNRIVIWDTVEHRQVRRLAAGPGIVSAVAWSPDGKWLAASHAVRRGEAEKRAPWGHVVAVWDAGTGELVKTLDDHTQRDFGPRRPRVENGASIAVSRDGQLIAHAGNGGKVSVWNRETGEILWTAGDDETWVRSLTFSGDGELLAGQVYGKHLTVWETADGRERCRMALAVGECGLALSPDGRRLASTDMRGTIRLWETDSGEQVFELRGLAGSFGTLAIRAQVAFDASGMLLSSFNNNDTTNVFDATPMAVAQP
jgi:WD40 repeat protein